VAPPAAAAPAVSAQALLAHETRRVRSTTPRVTKLLAEGARRSRTFADLITRIHETDVIVYVEANFNLPIETSGRILWAATAGNQRYLRVQVRATLQGDHMIAVIAHELRHALEVAAEPSVVDEHGIAALYKRIGDGPHGPVGYDTKAARDVGRIVRDELIG
jgi:hypothetical protein